MKKIFTFIAALLIAAGVGAQSTEPPAITLTTAKAVGETINLTVYATAADQADVWIDLNNNGVKDTGETVTNFGLRTAKTYTIGAKTVTLHGKVNGLSCGNNQLTTLNIANNKLLVYLDVSNNRLDVQSLNALYAALPDITGVTVVGWEEKEWKKQLESVTS